MHIWGYWYFFPAILIPACASSSSVLRMMYSANKLNKQSDNIQPWHTSSPILNQSVVPCLVLSAASWSAYTFLRRQVRRSSIPISWRIFHSLLWSTQSKTLHSQWSRSRCFSMIQLMLAIWSLVLPPLLNPAFISGSSWFKYCWSLAWKILSTILLACEISAIVW